MSNLFSERFRAARMLNGFSLQDLSNALGNSISRQALHKYEKGDVIPDSEMIAKLCKALKVQPDYFFRNKCVNISASSFQFRKQEGLSAKEQNKIIEATNDILSRYLEIEDIIGLSNSFKNPLLRFGEINSLEDIEDAVLKIRKNWNIGIGAICNSIELLENNNIKVISIECDDKFDGMQAWYNDFPIIIINRSILKTPDRIRFTIFHELGHLLLKFNDISDHQKERFCNQFAAAMLIPKETLQKEIGISRKKLLIQELGEIKKEYGISIQAIMYRCKDLDIISSSLLSELKSIIKEKNWEQSEPEDFYFCSKEQPSRFHQLILRAFAEGLISTSKAAVLNNQSILEFRRLLTFG